MKPTHIEGEGRFPALLRWLKRCWLFRGSGRGIPPPRPKAPPKQIEALETRCQPDDVFAAGQVLIGGSTLMALAAAFPTPAQVLMRGWGAGQPDSDLAPSRPADVPPPQPLFSLDRLDAFFSAYRVLPPGLSHFD